MVMKKLSVLAMAMIVMASCAKENVQPNNEPTGEKALLEIGLASTKTQLGKEDNGFFPIVWSEGDEIAVIENMGVEGKQNVSVYSLREGAGTANGVFELVDGSPKVTNNVDVVYPASAVKGKGLIKDISLLVQKDQTQSYEDGNFDKNAAVMYFHRNNPADKIVLEPLSSIICIPIKGFDDNDVVTAVKWQNMDGRTATVTLNCPNGVKLSKGQATNFYLSIQPMQTKNNKGEPITTVNAIVYVYLQNGAIQVQTPRNRAPLKYQAGSLHRFPEWTLSKKAKWTIKYIGSERKTSMSNQTPLGLGQYMIDGNDLSWWEFRRNSKGSMAGPHKVIIDLGKTEHIKGMKIKGPETKITSSYTVKDEFGENTIKVSDGYNAPCSVFASFLKEGELTEAFKSTFCNTKSFEQDAQEVHRAEISKGITYYYGEGMKNYWDIPLKKEYDARYLVIHFYQCWNDKENSGAASKMKVAELDIY